MDYLDEFKELGIDSVAIIAKNPRLYKELKSAVEEVVNGYVEIDDYFESAKNIVEILSEMFQGGKKTILDGFIFAIDPEGNGSASTYRILCTMLLRKINFFHDFRLEVLKLRVIK